MYSLRGSWEALKGSRLSWIQGGFKALFCRKTEPRSGTFSGRFGSDLGAPPSCISDVWPVSQARKKSTKINFLGPETAGCGGGLPREGVVAENFAPSLESLSSLGFEERNLGCPGNFAGMPGPLLVFQKFVQKSSCAFFVP